MTHSINLTVQSFKKITELDLEISRFSRHSHPPQLTAIISPSCISDHISVWLKLLIHIRILSQQCSFSHYSCRESHPFPGLQPAWTRLEIHSDFWMESVLTRMCL